jgi:protein tyrosine phosphatase
LRARGKSALSIFPLNRKFANTGLAQDENLVREHLEKMSCNVDESALILLPKISFNFFIIKNVGIKQKNGYSIRKIFLYYCNFHTKQVQQYTVYHYWFPDWPDHRSPSDIDVLLDMSLDLLDGNCTRDFEEVECEGECNAKSDKNPLPIIHCSAGIGRTGCLAAILNGLGQMRSNNNCSSGISVDILGIVCNLRLQRGGMVQNSEQYELIHRSLCLYQQKLYQQKN